MNGSITLKNAMAFMAVAENASFTKAANKLQVSKASISMQIKKLEIKLGVQLFNRTTRKITLTNEGHTYMTYCRVLLDNAQEAERAISQQNGEPFGKLRINAPMSFGQRYLAPAVADYLKIYPDISIDLNLTDSPVDLVEGGFDLALRIDSMPDSDLHQHKIADCRRVLIASPEYWKSRKKPVKPGQLVSDEALLYSYQAQSGEWNFIRHGKKYPLKVSGRLSVNNAEVILKAALNGVGYSVLPYFLCEKELEAGLLQEGLDGFYLPEETVYFAHTQQKILPHRTKAFISFFTEYCQNKKLCEIPA